MGLSSHRDVLRRCAGSIELDTARGHAFGIGGSPVSQTQNQGVTTVTPAMTSLLGTMVASGKGSINA